MKIYYDELNGMLCIDESVHIVGCGAVTYLNRIIKGG